MTSQILVPEEEQVKEVIGNNEDGVFVNCRSSFIITDELKVTSNSIGVLMEVLNDQGYASFSDLREILVDVGFEEVRPWLFFSHCLIHVITLSNLQWIGFDSTRMFVNLRSGFDMHVSYKNLHDKEARNVVSTCAENWERKPLFGMFCKFVYKSL